MKPSRLYVLLIFLFCQAAINTAVADQREKINRVYQTESYGRIDAIYPKDSRLIIDDMVYVFTQKTHFRNPYGDTVLKLENTIKPGMWVKTRYIKHGDVPVLTDIKVTTQREVEQSRRISDDDDR